MRLIVVHSSALEATAADRAQARQTQDAATLDRAIARLGKARFSCEADARKAWQESKGVKKSVWSYVGKVTQGATPNEHDAWPGG